MSNNPYDKNKAHVLTIGIGKRDEDNAGMTTTVKDAERIAAELKKRIGFPEANLHMVTDKDATMERILKELDDLAAKTAQAPADMAIIYFSGHGYRKGADLIYYLICNDTQHDKVTDALTNTIDGNLFVEKLLAIQTDKMLILLDCCHSGGFAPVDIPFSTDKLLEKPNRVIISASSGAELSYLSTPLSVFTYALVEGLAGKYFIQTQQDIDQNVTLFDLAMYLRERVVLLSESKQHPHLNILKSGTTSDFVIARYPNGKPTDPIFDSDFKLCGEGGKGLNTDGEPVRDEEYRAQYNWLINIDITGDNNIVVAGNVGDVAINSNNTINYYFNSDGKDIPYNQYLTKELIMSIKDPADEIKTVQEKDTEDPLWNQKEDDRNLAQNAIIKNYSNIVGSRIAKLFTIGKLSSPTQKKDYINQCIDVARTALQLLDFIPLLAEEMATIKYFFEYNDEKIYDIPACLKLFTTLLAIYNRSEAGKIKLPIDELEGFIAKLAPDNNFAKACSMLGTIQNSVDTKKFEIENCAAAEQSLTDILVALGFLASYKMVSIKSVNYDDKRNNAAYYLHQYVTIGASKGINYLKAPVSSDAILLYKNDYITDGINLFPFIIDYNALLQDNSGIVSSVVDACFYSSVYVDAKNIKNMYGKIVPTDKIRLFFPGDSSQKEIQNWGTPQSDDEVDFSVFFQDDANRVKFRNDNVFYQFNNAKETILGPGTKSIPA
jgi:hypothetical protein